jgi:hypothetical protein
MPKGTRYVKKPMMMGKEKEMKPIKKGGKK